LVRWIGRGQDRAAKAAFGSAPPDMAAQSKRLRAENEVLGKAR
jgi:hypothetical protein